MTEIPSCEAILLEIQQSFGTNSLQTLEKRRFANLEKKMSEHHAMAVEIIKEVVSTLHLGHDPALRNDLVASAIQVLQFHGAVEAGTRIFGAGDRQVAWHLLAYQIVPGLARKYGFWSLAAPVAPGMAGGDLWFLPRPTPSDANCLRLPVQTVTEWWLDLLDCPYEDIWKDDKDGASRLRNLQNWRVGKLPTPATIGGNFDTNHKFRYLGTFQDRPGAPLEARFASALAFVRDRKRLDAPALAMEIPHLSASVIEAALSEAADEREMVAFVAAIAERWREPSNDTVRRRFLLARVVQDAHVRLAKLINPDVSPLSADPVANKVLQLWALFAEIYRLTLEADRGCRSETESNARFATLVPDWLAQGLLKSIMSVHRGAPEEFALFLSDRFRELEIGAAIGDLFKGGDISAGAADRQVAAEHATRTELESLLERLRDALDGRRKDEAEVLLQQAKEHPRREEYLADVLFFEGWHSLNGNGIDEAKNLFEEAFETCRRGGYGTSRKSAAYACLGMAMSFDHFSERAERYFRVISRSMEPSETAGYQPWERAGVLSLDTLFRDVSARASEMFWEELYRPYPGTAPLTPPAVVQFDDLLKGLVEPFANSDGEAIGRWVQSNRKLLDERLRDVRGDTFFNVALKIVNTLERNIPPSVIHRGMGISISRQRTSLHLLAGLLSTKALNTPDFKRQTPPMLAADQGDAKLVGILLDRDVDLDAQDVQGRTALHSAAASRSAECYVLILRKGADPTRQTADKLSPLHSAVKFGLPEAVGVTLEKWPDRFAQDEIARLLEMARDFHANYKTRRTQMAQMGRILGPKPAYKMIAVRLERTVRGRG